MLRRTTNFLKGDLTAIVVHDCNPQHGAPYNNHDRTMRDEEFQAFLKSVKGWTVLESGAIHRTFEFANYKLAYEWMGRLFAYSYTSDKYPKLQWHGTHVEVTIYSGRFHGITKREARLAAFMNDHFNLLRKAQVAQKEHLEASKATNIFRDGVTPLIEELTRGPQQSLKDAAEAKKMKSENGDNISSSTTTTSSSSTTKINFADLGLSPEFEKGAKRVSHDFASDQYAMAAMLKEAKAEKIAKEAREKLMRGEKL